MRATAAVLVLVATTAPVSADDFSGFYAGVNAGYIAERGDRSRGIPSFAPGAREAEAGLPPSALDAADRMTGGDARARPHGSLRR